MVRKLRNWKHHALLIGKLNVFALESSLAVLRMLDTELANHPETLFLGTYPQEMKTDSHTKICTNVCSIIFIITKTWKQLKCPSNDEWKKASIH